MDGSEQSINTVSFGCTSNCVNSTGFILTQTYDGAGRPNKLTSSITDLPLHPPTLISGVAYNAGGQITAMNYANGLTETRAYNNRLQPCRLNLNSSATTLASCTAAIPGGNVQDFNYGFNVGTADNGNVASFVGTGQQTFNRTYTYDSLNRLGTMADSASGQVCKGLSWTYDGWANRTAQSVTAGACGTFSVSVNTNNQFVGAPYTYDAAGNMTHDASHSYTFDAENHITKVDGGSTSTYLYDANGRRAEQITPHGGYAGSLQAHFWYDTSGRIRTMWDQAGTYMIDHVYLGGEYILSYSTEFVFKDLLGSTRILTHVDKSIEDSLDYLPFGEQQTGGSYTSLKFTGKEHDIDSGLDNFGARYMGSSLGRFMSPDAFYNDSHIGDPQSWNEYAYARNNPLRYVDPTGENATVSTSCTTDGDNRTTCNVNVSATIAIYAAPGSGLTQEQLNGAASTIQSSIQNTWSGSFQQDGVTYNVSTQVSVQVAGSEGAASETGAQNVIGLSNGPADAAQDRQDFTGRSNSLATFLRGQDTGIWNYNTLGGTTNDAAHEFAHVLGVGDHYDGNYVSNGHLANTPQQAAGSELGWGIQEATSGVRSWLNAPQYRPMRYGEAFEKPQTFSGSANMGAPWFGWWK